MIRVMSLESSRDPSAPFVTFYDGATGERTELSGTSFANWRAKTANYLRDGIGLSAADRIDLRLPLHWVVPVWLAAARDLGVTVSIASDAGLSEPADLAVVGPQTLADAPTNCDVVACSLRPLAAPFADRLPVGIEDFFAEVRNFGDHFSAPHRGRATDPLLNLGNADLDIAGIHEAIATQVSDLNLNEGARLLLSPKPGPEEARGELSDSQLLACYDLPHTLSGSVVIAINQTPAQLAEIARQERVTAHLLA